MKKIVLIDDDKNVCELMRKTLANTQKYEVLTANDGTTGKQLCLKVKPDLIILDFVMPGENGNEVIKFLKEHEETKDIMVVLMSGLGEMVYLEKKEQWKWEPNTDVVNHRGEIPEPMAWKKLSDEVAAEMGVTVYLVKPFSRNVLLDVADSLLNPSPKEED